MRMMKCHALGMQAGDQTDRIIVLVVITLILVLLLIHITTLVVSPLFHCSWNIVCTLLRCSRFCCTVSKLEEFRWPSFRQLHFERMYVMMTRTMIRSMPIRLIVGLNTLCVAFAINWHMSCSQIDSIFRLIAIEVNLIGSRRCFFRRINLNALWSVLLTALRKWVVGNRQRPCTLICHIFTSGLSKSGIVMTASYFRLIHIPL